MGEWEEDNNFMEDNNSMVISILSNMVFSSSSYVRQ